MVIRSLVVNSFRIVSSNFTSIPIPFVAALSSLLSRLRTGDPEGWTQGANDRLRLVRNHCQKDASWPIGQHPALFPIAHGRHAEPEAGRKLGLTELQTAPQKGDIRHCRPQLRFCRLLQ